MSEVKRVALVFPVFNPHLDPMTQGILKYARERNEWRFAYSPDGPVASLKCVQHWRGDGVIAFFGTKEEMMIAKSLKTPLVNLSASQFGTDLATVSSDNYRIGCIAAEHLLERKFRSFGYYGVRDVWYSDERCRGFVETVEGAGGLCTMCLDTVSYDGLTKIGQLEHESVRVWLRKLELPVGILAVHDYRARLIMEMCKELGLHIPNDVAVIGVNNDPTACLFASPTLSSVAHDGVRVGMEAAALLDRLMKDPEAPRLVLQVPPLGVVSRESTDTLAVEEETLRKVLELIKTSYVDDIGIEQIAGRMGVSRRWLEKLFKVHLHSTPHEYLSEIRVHAAMKLLASKPPIKLNEIAQRCGFYDVRRLNKVFTRVAGMSPREYAKKLGERTATR